MIRVLVADDHPAVRVGVERLLRGEPGLLHAGSAETADTAVEEAGRIGPDCALIDYQLPGGGLNLCWRLKAGERPPAVVVYSAFAGDGLAVGARLAGADAVLDKAAPATEIFESIRRAVKGGCTIEPPRAALLRGSEALDAHDLPIFGMLVEGTPPLEIARTLMLEPVEFDRRVRHVLGLVEQRLGLAAG